MHQHNKTTNSITKFLIILTISLSTLLYANNSTQDQEIQMPNINEAEIVDTNEAEIEQNTKEAKEAIGNIIEIQTYSKNVRKHPIINHLAVSLPIIILIVSILSLIIHKRLSAIDLILLMISSAAIYFSFISGNEAYDLVSQTPIAPEARNILLEHKKIGYTILIGASIVMGLRLILILYKPKNLILSYLLILILYIGLIAYQSYTGINMVYKYGVGIYYDKISK